MTVRRNANTMNAILTAGGTVTTVNHGKSVRYTKKHAGMFSEGKDGNIFVRHGKGYVRLSTNGGALLLCRFDCTLPEGITMEQAVMQYIKPPVRTPDA